MNKTILILTSVLFLTSSKSFCQNETNLLSFNDFNSNSFAFIEFIKNYQESDELAKWYEGKIDERLAKTLNELSLISRKYPQGLEITVIPFGSIPEKNNPLFIIYHLVDLKEKKELSFLFSYSNNNLLIDNLTSVKLTDLLKDSIRNPLPEPPRNRNN